MFAPERNLKDLILYHVKAEERSISALTRDLHKDGFKFHRLFLTGYLKALADVGMLREKKIPPSKVYTTSAHRSPNLYEALGEAVRQEEKDPARGTRLCVAVLQKIFHRPVFLRELRECGFDAVGDVAAAPKELVDEARRVLATQGLKIPANEPAYGVEDRKNEARDAILTFLLADRYGMRDQVLVTRQAKLAP